MERRWPWQLCLGIAALSTARMLLTLGDLPPTVASHFGADGQANGFQSRVGFVIMALSMMGLMLALFLGLPRLLRHFPSRMVNLPNRAYWLSDERKDEAMAKLSYHLNVIGLLTLGFMAAVYELVMRANLQSKALDSAWMIALLVGLYAGLLTRIVLVYRDFRLPESARADGKGEKS